jgi:hypothetical protein
LKLPVNLGPILTDCANVESENNTNRESIIVILNDFIIAPIELLIVDYGIV